jgi:hypothetical protein
VRKARWGALATLPEAGIVGTKREGRGGRALV